MIRSATNVVRFEPRLPRPSIKERFHVVIAGGGFSGVALAAHLVRSGDSRLEITLLDECEAVERGTACARERDRHLPGTRAADLGVFEDERDDFVHWLRRHGVDCPGQDFVSGHSLAAWLEDKLIETSRRAAQADIPFTVRAATRIMDLMQREDACLVGLDDGASIRCDAVVLAAVDTPAGRRAGHAGAGATFAPARPVHARSARLRMGDGTERRRDRSRRPYAAPLRARPCAPGGTPGRHGRARAAPPGRRACIRADPRERDRRSGAPARASPLPVRPDRLGAAARSSKPRDTRGKQRNHLTQQRY